MDHPHGARPVYASGNKTTGADMKAQSMLGALLVLAALAGCSRQDEMGAAQKAGKAVDDVGAKVAQKLHEQQEKANQAAQEMARAAERTREKIKDATADASNGLGRATEEVGKKVEQAGENIQDRAK
jgi:hypothetical protein